VSLLALRKKMRLRNSLLEVIAARLDTDEDVQGLFVAATSLEDVLGLVATAAADAANDVGGCEAEPALAALFCPVLKRCGDILQAGGELSQPECLAISLAELVLERASPGEDGYELACQLCSRARELQRQRRRGRMNMLG